MTPILYVEASMCSRTGAAGWGAVLQRGPTPDQWTTLSGRLAMDLNGSVTLAELAGLQVALFHVLNRRLLPGKVIDFALRSTAALAVLQWVFPQAPVITHIPIEPPKTLKASTREFDPLYDLHEDVDEAGLTISLCLVTPSDCTELAATAARIEMEQARVALRRSA